MSASGSVSPPPTKGRSSHTCINCKKHPYDRHQPEKICSKCIRRLEKTVCQYCSLDFHQLDKDKGGRPACPACLDDWKIYGEPQRCQICQLPSAFNPPTCTHCRKAEKKYGAPTGCDLCGKAAAFRKPDADLQKIGGKPLCLLCTRERKRQLRKEQKEKASTQGKRKRSDEESEEEVRPAKHQRLDTDELPAHTSESEMRRQYAKQAAALRAAQEEKDKIQSSSIASSAVMMRELEKVKSDLERANKELTEATGKIATMQTQHAESERVFKARRDEVALEHNEITGKMRREIDSLRVANGRMSKLLARHNIQDT